MVAFNSATTGDEVVKTYAAETKGKTILITGPSQSGVGAQTAIFLAQGQPEHIILAGRNKSKIQPVVEEIQKINSEVIVSVVQLDLADFSSIHAAAEEIIEKVEKLDILINNAGVMAIKDYQTTKDGVEMQFGSNHIGHFLLTNLLMPKILAAGRGARIVNVSSFGYMSGGVYFDDPSFKNGAEYNPWTAYSQSKTANILFTTGLANKLENKGILAFALNPGLIFESKLMANVDQAMFADGQEIATKALKGQPIPEEAMQPKSLAAGSSTSLYAALAPELSSHSGAFLVDAKIWTAPLMDHARGVDKADKLWALSEKIVNQNFDC